MDSRSDDSRLHVRIANLDLLQDQQDLLQLLNLYASNLVGRWAPLPDDIRHALVPALQSHPTTRVFLAELSGAAVGVAVCFVGFSTFKAKPLLNIHDLAVHPDFQNLGVGSALIEAVCKHAQQQQHCAVTLEVQANNPARRLYARHGFQVLSMPTDDSTMLFGKREIHPVQG